jgi:hypothetical protein
MQNAGNGGIGGENSHQYDSDGGKRNHKSD